MSFTPFDAALNSGLLGDREVAACFSVKVEIAAMAHKRNPVKTEAIVTLARFNATLVSGMHQALVHEQERSGAAWTLEWMLLPQMCVATGASTRLALELLDGVERLGRAAA